MSNMIETSKTKTGKLVFNLKQSFCNCFQVDWHDTSLDVYILREKEIMK